MKTLRLILGDQLNLEHSWYKEDNKEVIYLMAEMRQETDYVRHHIQKVIGFFGAMRAFAQHLRDNGLTVVYYGINDKKNPQVLEQLITKTIKEHQINRFEYQLPDEYRLDQQLEKICNKVGIETKRVDTEHFYTTRDELAHFFKGKKQLIMESFYRMMRKKHDVMMVNNQPDGGKWNFDHSNRKKWNGIPTIPKELDFKHDVSDLLAEIENSGIQTMGYVNPKNFPWPLNKKECLALLDYFCNHLLIHFGDYQDAQHTREKFLFHSRLSFAMNTKMIGPNEVIDRVVNYYYDHTEKIDISQVEGFVRQIIGWREYMRGIYWKEMPEYAQMNKLENYRKLPEFFWTGKTKMNCLKYCIGQSLGDAYAHHIQRLMVIGNFALLAELHPNEVDAWYLGIYIDAIEWVEMPNTRGMSQWADGGIVATKPYVSSANYINKMGDYCKGCHYKHSQKVGKDACPFNSLYWNFLDEKKNHFENNNRMSMMLNLLDKINPEELKALKERANYVLEHLDEL